MKSLQDRVNLVPVIAKSDTLTRREVGLLKNRVRTALAISEHYLFHGLTRSRSPYLYYCVYSRLVV